MRYFGIDVASEEHALAGIGEDGATLVAPTRFKEDAEGHEKAVRHLGAVGDVLIVMEATGHYWCNLFIRLESEGYKVAVINPLRAKRFAESDLSRTSTDELDALTLARFAQQKRPVATRLPDAALEEIRELVRHRTALVQEFGDKTRQLHRMVDLVFPEFTRYVKELDSKLATAVLNQFPTAAELAKAKPKALAQVEYGSRHHRIGSDLAHRLVEAARTSVGKHSSAVYQRQVRYYSVELDRLRKEIERLDDDIEKSLSNHEVSKLLLTIDGLGPNTVARLVARFGNPADYRDGAALAAYAGLVPGLKLSGKRTPVRAGLSFGNVELRSELWMPTLVAVRHNPWLKAFYDRLIAKGKPRKLALIAAMRKLLHAVHSVARNRRPFTPLVMGAPLETA